MSLLRVVKVTIVTAVRQVIISVSSHTFQEM